MADVWAKSIWHVIPEPRITLQGATTWWIHCHDSRATCHIAGCSHLAKSVSWSCHIAGCIRHIENRFSPYFIFFVFLMQFRLWRAAAFVSSPIHLSIIGLIVQSWFTPPNNLPLLYMLRRCYMEVWINAWSYGSIYNNSFIVAKN